MTGRGAPVQGQSPQRSTGGIADSDVLAAVRSIVARLKRLEDLVDGGGSRLLVDQGPMRQSSRPPEAPTGVHVRPPRPGSAPPSAPEATIAGILRDTLLSDVLQLVSSNKLTGEFAVEDGQVKNVLYFKEGEIVHAAGPGLSGEGAVFAAMSMQVGRYRFRETEDLPSEKTINANTQFLILEALRRIDESQGA